MDSKSSLSSNVLQMKFMKRSALRIEHEKSEEERQYLIDDEHWVLDLPETPKNENRFITEASFERCSLLQFGRMSFKGFNPEIEKLMKVQNAKLGLEEAEQKEREDGVGDKEMAQRYESLVGTISNKFATKRQRSENQARPTDGTGRQKKKFLRPADD